MEFRTHIDIQRSKTEISHESSILLLGSCFSDNIGEKLSDGGFHVCVNPLGTLYNPASIKEALSPSQWDEFKEWLHTKARPDEWHPEEWKRGKVIIITFGTAWIYRLRETGMIVANCKKQPDRLFQREKLSVDEIVRMWAPLIENEFEDSKFIFTVSPIRHKKDGFHENQLSKATLLLAISELCTRYPERCEYFPAYEIMMDELRDYRFYADDMLHPSEVAVEYIWQCFQNTYFSEPTKQKVAEEEKRRRQERHIPLTPLT